MLVKCVKKIKFFRPKQVKNYSQNKFYFNRVLNQLQRLGRSLMFLKLQGAILETLKNSGVDFYNKKAKVTSNHTVLSENEEFFFEKLVIQQALNQEKLKLKVLKEQI